MIKLKIRVSYSELKSDGQYNNRKAEAEIEIEVNGNLNETFDRSFARVKKEVKKQLGEDVKIDDDLPF